jgi:hypothetical protein
MSSPSAAVDTAYRYTTLADLGHEKIVVLAAGTLVFIFFIVLWRSVQNYTRRHDE